MINLQDILLLRETRLRLARAEECDPDLVDCARNALIRLLVCIASRVEGELASLQPEPSEDSDDTPFVDLADTPDLDWFQAHADRLGVPICVLDRFNSHVNGETVCSMYAVVESEATDWERRNALATLRPATESDT